jgi:hypothetical protein
MARIFHLAASTAAVAATVAAALHNFAREATAMQLRMWDDGELEADSEVTLRRVAECPTPPRQQR